MSEVTLKGLKKIYEGGVTAVHDVNLEIRDKEFIVLVGPSGCGKSTTLRMVAGLEEISGGDLLIDGKRMNDVEPKDRDIAMVFQSYALYPHMSVYDNMGFALKLHKTPKAEIDRKVREVAKILDIEQYLDRKPKALSGGQRQRVAIGRAMVRDPKVFLMDEPLSNLDAKLRNQMRAEIIKLRQRINTTFIYVTHDQTEAMTLGDRIVIMKDGFVNQIGTPSEVFDKPVNLFVAGFIGTPVMNFFDESRLLLENGIYYAEIFGTRFALSPFQQSSLRSGGVQPCDIIAGIRPQHLSICGNGSSDLPRVQTSYEAVPPLASDTTVLPLASDEAVPSLASDTSTSSMDTLQSCSGIPSAAGSISPSNTLTATIEVSEMLGSEYNLHAKIGNTSIVMVIPTNDLHADVSMGSQVEFTTRPECIQLFDKESGNNLIWFDPDSAAANAPVCRKYQ